MAVLHAVPLALVLVLSTAAVAQESPAPGPAPDAAASMPCAKPMPRHDHGAEKGTPTPMRDPCSMSPAAPVEKKAKAKRGHDHARFHKLM